MLWLYCYSCFICLLRWSSKPFQRNIPSLSSNPTDLNLSLPVLQTGHNIPDKPCIVTVDVVSIEENDTKLTYFNTVTSHGGHCVSNHILISRDHSLFFSVLIFHIHVSSMWLVFVTKIPCIHSPRKYLSSEVYQWCIVQGPVLLTLLRHVANILANGSAAFFESCDAIGWNSCDMSQKR